MKTNTNLTYKSNKGDTVRTIVAIAIVNLAAACVSVKGADGAQGSAGLAGLAGVRGPAGSAGPAGASAMQFADATDSTIAGLSGDPLSNTLTYFDSFGYLWEADPDVVDGIMRMHGVLGGQAYYQSSNCSGVAYYSAVTTTARVVMEDDLGTNVYFYVIDDTGSATPPTTQFNSAQTSSASCDTGLQLPGVTYSTNQLTQVTAPTITAVLPLHPVSS